MTDFAYQPTITIRYRRCWDCNAWWGYEVSRKGVPTCPFCAGEAVRRATVERDRLTRSNASLRGVLKRKGKSQA